MNTKVDDKFNELIPVFKSHLGWNLARIKFLYLFLSAVMKVQTVNFMRLSECLNCPVKLESNLRRIQRFFAWFVIDFNTIAKLVFLLLPGKPPYKLCMDRTNWKFGRTDINILMLSVCYMGVSIPLLWKMLPKRGNSNSSERKELFDMYTGLFGIDSIESFLADREFIGDDWIGQLVGHKIRFYIRIKENMWIDVPGKGRKKAFWLFNSLPLNKAMYYRKIVQLGTQLVYISGLKTYNNKENKIEFVIIASYSYDEHGLLNYRHRWQIETMFKALKTSGFNLEDTHLNDLSRISKMVALLSIAFVWAYIIGLYLHKHISPIKVKSHGRKAYSFFKYGLSNLAKSLFNEFDNQEFKSYIKILSCT